MKRTLISAATLSLFATAALAMTPSFSDVDVDSDGIVTQEEFASALPDASELDFMIVDADGNGLISEAEMAKASDSLDAPKG